MTMLQVIEKKKLGQELSPEEIRFFAAAAAERTAPDYQLSALLMAIRLNGMTDRETTELTLAMRDSGDIADLSGIPGIKVDKHSTGGVGDTTTLVLAPLVAACGAPVAKMSGRGLGHTGGTLDKLESIPGLRVQLSVEEFIDQVRRTGVAVVGQTGHLAPADKTLYALRDVTSTVDSLPLIVSSILSKKLAAGSDAIVLDVKTGSGALMHTLEDSLNLARSMVRVGELAGKPITALISGMDQPLGTHVGNALEVKEAIDILAGRAGGDLLEVSLTLGGYMLELAGIAETPEEGKARMRRAIADGTGLKKLRTGRLYSVHGHHGAGPGGAGDGRWTHEGGRRAGLCRGLRDALPDRGPGSCGRHAVRAACPHRGGRGRGGKSYPRRGSLQRCSLPPPAEFLRGGHAGRRPQN